MTESTNELKEDFGSPPDIDISRRSAAAALGAVFGLGALVGCERSDSGGRGVAAVAAALSGSSAVPWTDTMEELRNMLGTPTSPVAVLKGYWEPGDGGGGVMFWDSDDVTSPDDGGTVIVPSFVGPRTGCWKRLIEGAWSVRWFGARGDNTNPSDNDSAFADAIAAMSDDRRGQELFVPPGQYRFTAPIVVDKSITLCGVGGGWGSASELKFPAGVNGIQIVLGAWAVVQNICVSGSAGFGPTSASEPVSHGIIVWGRALIDHVYVKSFRGSGILVQGSMPASNANVWTIRNTIIQLCGSHGLHVDGPDANAGFGLGIDSSDNGHADPAAPGWGILDSSFLGNTFVACHTDNNAGGPYKSDEVTARSMFLGCYSEQGQPTSQLSVQSMALGGEHGAGVAGWRAYPGNLSPFKVTGSGGWVHLGSYGLLGFQAASEAEDYPYHFTYHPGPNGYGYQGWYCLKFAGIDGWTPFAVSGRGAVEPEGRAWLPTGYYLAAGQARRYVTAIVNESFLPRVATVGNVVINANPAVNGIAQWHCVQTNTATVPAQWRAVRLDTTTIMPGVYPPA